MSTGMLNLPRRPHPPPTSLLSPKRPTRPSSKPPRATGPRASLESLPTLRRGPRQAGETLRGTRDGFGLGSAPSQGRAASFQLGERTAFYAANTSNGTVRTYNEDRVSIVINVKRKSAWSGKRWPSCAFFGVFDGHGGAACADFLKDNLHSYILDQDCFPEDVPRAITRGCERAESEFCRFATQQTNVERSGSCGVVALLIDDIAYVGNVGDSRAIACERRGRGISVLSRDHKPEDTEEQERILRAGGTVSKGNGAALRGLPSLGGAWLPDLPHRVYPGGLSVSRAFGDVCAKDPRLGGRPGVLVAKPEIVIYKLPAEVDYLLLGCDGLFDKFPNKRVVETINAQLEEGKGPPTPERRLEACARAVDAVIAAAAKNLSYDNLTAILVSFRPLSPPAR